jgi:trehalose 6-phosphate phosphatase
MWELSLDEATQMDTELSSESGGLLPPDQIDLQRTALFLDVDGTLIEIAATPQDVVVPPTLRGTLKQLFERSGEAVALVSGRTVEALDRLFQPLLMPAVGEHGAEIRLSAHGPLLQNVASLGRELRERIHLLTKVDSNILVEEKSHSMSVHYRRAPRHEVFLKKEIARIVASEADPDSVEFMFGKTVIDIKPRIFNKGSAVREMMASAPFAGRRLLFIGDDTTDEAVFAILPELNGIGFAVGRSVKGAQGTFSSPAHVRSWLARIAASARA